MNNLTTKLFQFFVIVGLCVVSHFYYQTYSKQGCITVLVPGQMGAEDGSVIPVFVEQVICDLPTQSSRSEPYALPEVSKDSQTII